jgi:hypothetical protein
MESNGRARRPRWLLPDSVSDIVQKAASDAPAPLAPALESLVLDRFARVRPWSRSRSASKNSLRTRA